MNVEVSNEAKGGVLTDFEEDPLRAQKEERHWVPLVQASLGTVKGGKSAMTRESGSMTRALETLSPSKSLSSGTPASTHTRRQLAVVDSIYSMKGASVAKQDVATEDLDEWCCWHCAWESWARAALEEDRDHNTGASQ
mmetsp:Transcript_72805/g.168758  ORF Transcript_72805/g.168758 Transcript_72805/m.168758 type:complete len:138 (-) Transcript_72805:229-642(-)